MLPMEVSDRTFHIEFQNCSGTAFAFDRGGKQYLVTATHLVEGLTGRSAISIWYDGGWQQLAVELVGHGEVDVSVIAAAQLLADPQMILEPAVGGWFVGQDAFVVGFPLGFSSPGYQSLFPTPVLKRSCISGRLGDQVSDPYLIDNISNPGFSGAPVYLKIHGDSTYKVSLIVSSSPNIKEPVYDEFDARTNLHVRQDSGMTFAYNIKVALDLIDANPIGCPTTS